MPTANELPFTKMHGCGNDYAVVDGFQHEVEAPERLAATLCERRWGVGCDGLLLALPSDRADFRMRMFNADGTEAEMCGNGLRCLVKFVLEEGCVPWAAHGRVETGAGILAYAVDEASHRDGIHEVEIDMGRPDLAKDAVDVPLVVEGARLPVTVVSMGNPHAVTWVDDVASCAVEDVGRAVEHHEAFPQRTNVEFVETVSRGEVHQRTWERGCGETLACGTGACAVVAAGVVGGRLDREVLVHLRGGDLRIAWPEDGTVRMRGPAVRVFEGVWPLAGR